MGLFGSSKKKEKRSMIMNLLMVMFADGEVSDDEKAFLMHICDREGIPRDEVVKVMKNPDKIKFRPPKDDRQRFQQLVDAVSMMLIDGDIDQDEMDFCIQFALALGFRPTVVHKLVNDIRERLGQGDDSEKVKAEVEEFLAG